MTLSNPRETRDKNGLPCVIMAGTCEMQAYAFCFGGEAMDVPDFNPFDTVYEIEVPGLLIPVDNEGFYALDTKDLFVELLDKIEAHVRRNVDTAFSQPHRIKTAALALEPTDVPILQAALSKMQDCERIARLREKLDGYARYCMGDRPVEFFADPFITDIPEKGTKITVHGREWLALIGLDEGERALWLVPDEDARKGMATDQRYWQVDLNLLLPAVDDPATLTDEELLADAARMLNRFEAEVGVDDDRMAAWEGQTDVLDGLRDWAVAGYRLAAAVCEFDMNRRASIQDALIQYVEATRAELPAEPAGIPWLDCPDVPRGDFEKVVL